MLKRLLFASALMAGAAAGGLPAGAELQTCGDRQAIVQRLTDLHGEVRQDSAEATGSSAYEFFASEATGTWTILLSGINGMSCVIAVGEDWSRKAPNLPARGG